MSDPRVALVTGSSHGIGAAVARALAADGWTVVVNSHSSIEEGRRLADELPGASYVGSDVSDEGSVRAMIDTAVQRHGRLDLLVNNAATGPRVAHADIDAITGDIWREVLDTNVVGSWYAVQAAAPHLRRSPDGHVVNMGSIAGVRPTGSSVPYAVSKAALHHLTRLLANALAPEIRVNAIAPGLIDTPRTETWTDLHEAIAVGAPLRRAGTGADVAEMVLGLVRSRYVTGEVILVDGGVHLR